MKKTLKKVYKTILDNGLTILTYPTHVIPKVSVQLWYGVGSKDELRDEKGIAHLIEHMIFKGTKKLSESDINVITHKLSGSCNAFTSYDYTGYMFDFPTQNWSVSLDILSDCMSNCTFKQDLLTSELKAVIQELKMYKDQYSSSLVEELISTIFVDHPYHYPIIGYKQDLWSLDRDTLEAFYKKHYVPNNATLVVVGDVSADDVVAKAQASFGSIAPNKNYKKQQFYHGSDIISKSVTLYRDIAQPIGLMCFEIPGAKAKIDYLTDVLSWLIGAGRGSRLYKKLVDELQLVADIASFSYDLFDHGLFCIYFYPKNYSDISKIQDIILSELHAMGQEGFSEAELLRATKKSQVEYLSSFESNQRLANIIGKFYLATEDEQYLFNYLNYPSETLRADCADFIRQHMRHSVVHTGSVLPIAESEKKYWALLQERSDQEDMKILSRKVRHSSVEPAEYANTIKASPPAVFPFPKPTTISLQNGLKVLYYNHPVIDKVDLILSLKAKHNYDPDDKQGLNNFVCQMIYEGTKNYPGQALVDTIESYGMAISIVPGVISMSMLSKDLSKGLELLNELVANATLDKSSMPKVREKINAEIKNYWDNPSQFSGQLITQYIYGDGPLSNNILGTAESIERITHKDIVDYYSHYFSPDQARISAVGNLNGYDMNLVMQKAIGQWNGPKIEDLPEYEISATVAKKIDYPINRDQVVLAFAGLSISRLDPDYDKLLLFDQIFTGGALGSMSSRLFQIREQSGLFYTIGGSLLARSSEHPGMVVIKSIVSCDRLAEAEKLIKKTIETAADQVSDQEFEQARNAIVNSLVDYFESLGQMASVFLFIDKYNLPADFFDKRAQQLLAIDKQQMCDAVQKILRTDALLTLRIGRVAECPEDI